MRLASKSKFINRLGFIDIFCLLVSPFIALWLREPGFLNPGSLPFAIPITYQYAFLTVISSIPIMMIFRISESLTHVLTARDALNIILACCSSVIASILVVFFFSRLDGIPRSVPVIHGMILAFGILGHRLASRSMYDFMNKNLNPNIKNISNHVLRRIIIVGLDPFALSVLRVIEKQNPQTSQVVAIVSLSGKYVARTVSNRLVLKIEDLGRSIDEFGIHGVAVDEIWISDSSIYFTEDIYENLKDLCSLRGIKIKTISDALHLVPIEKNQQYTIPHDSNFKITNMNYLKFKDILDIFIGSFLFILCLPAFIIISLLIAADVGWPIIFWQERIGRYGNSFRVFKFRTLAIPQDHTSKEFKEPASMQPIGKLIRKFRIDELLQLLNVILGEMSTIGPRPLLPKDQPAELGYIRLLVKPGITGWAQINGGELLSSEEKNALDCWYIHNISFNLDVMILFRTLIFLFEGSRRNEKIICKTLEWFKKQYIYPNQ